MFIENVLGICLAVMAAGLGVGAITATVVGVMVFVRWWKNGR